MNVKSLEEKTYKNYKELCIELGMEVKSSQNSRDSQYKELARHCYFEKNGHKITICNIYESPFPKVDGRGKSIGSRNNRRIKEPLSETNPMLAAQWMTEANGMDIPESVTRRTTVKYWWKCSICNTKLHSSPFKRFNKSKTLTDDCITCAYCWASKGAKKIFRFLNLCDPEVRFETEHTFEDLIGLGGSKLRFDFAIYKGKHLITLIEYDGQYHNEDLNPDKDQYERVKAHDKLKDQYCLDNNYPLLRINYLEIDNVEMILADYLSQYNIKSQVEVYMNKNEYKLKSINVIAYLKLKGIKPIRIEKDEENQIAHYFNKTEEFQYLLKEYRKDKYLQEFITQVSETRKQIKSLV